MADNREELQGLINLTRLENLFDEWMKSTFWNVSLVNNILTVFDKHGTRTSTNVKGDPFTYDDFTPEQIAELQRPATDAISDCEEATSKANKAANNANAGADNANQKAHEANTACQNAQAAADEWNNTYKQQVGQAILDAQGVENLDAELDGMTVTITNRSGQSKSVDIGFDIYRTYTSVAAMNADASNVPLGKFVMIATTDKTSEENARMYIKSSQGNFRLLCDLDQASAEAWADWLNNKKPVIEDAIEDAINATSAANAAAHDANAAASNADASRERMEENEQTRESNETTRQDNEQARVSAETTRQTNWGEWFSDTLSTGVRKLWNNFWADVNTSWNSFFGTDENSGVRGDWNTLRDDVISKTQAAQTATTNANTAASNADSKATIANDAATNANNKAEIAQTAADNADESRVQIEANEQTRESNETTRQDNEQARVSAETTRQTNWGEWFSDTLSTGVRKLWNNFWADVNTSWNSFFGTDENSGVRGDWNTLRDDVISKTQAAQTATTNANTAASNADSKATIANDAATNANNKAEIAQTAADNADESRVQIEANEQTRQDNEQSRVDAESQRKTDWIAWFSDTLPNGVRKLWNDFWTNITTSWTTFFGINEDSGVRGEWKTLKSDIISKTQAADTATSNANTAASNANDKAALANEKAALANEKAALADEKATRADNAAVGAENVNATISGTTLTVTDRNGASTSVDTKGDKGDDMTWQTMTQEDKDALVNTVVEEASKKLNVASVETCESIIDELT